MKRRLITFVGLITLIFGLVSPIGSADQGLDATNLTAVDGAITETSRYENAAVVVDGKKMVSVIVKLDGDPLATYEGDVPGYAATSPAVTGDDKLDVDSNAAKRYKRKLKGDHDKFESDLKKASPDAEVTQRFDLVIGGVSALVPLEDVDRISGMSGVQAVFLDSLQQLDTERSPQFIGADNLWNQLGGQQMAGEGVIVGVIDSGIWPEHPSMSDPDPFGNAYPAPPTAPGSNGFVPGISNACDFGDTAFNPADAAFTCNNKLIGAYDFTGTYKAVVGLIPAEFDSARDSNGHGTHTSTTAAGNGGVAATLLGVSRGTVSGISPRSHVIMYKGCGLDGCFGSDTSAAMQQAILDEVDVMNYSISGGGDPYGDVVSLAFLDAYAAGVLVTPSAGNSGPGADTVAHREPWTLTVGASTSDRHFLSDVSLSASNGDTLALTGASVTAGIPTATDVVFPPFGSELCLTPFAAGTFSGEIVICERGVIARVAKSFNVAAGGAGGLLLYNPVTQGLATDNHFIPSVHLEADAGTDLLAFIGSHTGVTATFTDGSASTVQGDVMAAFSSRGGSNQTLGISKPDVTAPGVQILAGHTLLPENQDGGLPGQLFQSIQGTSMSAPHAAGAAALLKAAHPDWSPGQIKSALMMTAKTAGVTKEDATSAADPFDMGSGRIDPTAAAAAQLLISEGAADFLALETSLWDANYPSLYVPVMPGIIKVERTAFNPTNKNTKWDLWVDAPADLKVKVPNKLKVKKGKDKTFRIKVDARMVPLGETRHATLYLQERKSDQILHFPITIVRRQAGVTLDKTCTPTTLNEGDITTCTITVENTMFSDVTVSMKDPVPKQLKLIKSSVTGATKVKGRTVKFDGTLFAATPPAPDVAVDPLASPFGYFPLSTFGIPDEGLGDESIVNFGIPSFDYAGQSHNTIGIVSNGYIVVGGGTGADVNFINSDLPDAALPNNVLAPFWTDLNPAFGGPLSGVRIAVLSAGGNVWTVVEWDQIPNWGDGEINTFQVWIGSNTDANPGEDVSFTYGGPTISDGDGGFLTVGVENEFGNEGGTIYFDGVGTPPAPSFPFGSFEVDVFSVPGAPGETVTVTFDAEGHDDDDWWNWAFLKSDSFFGTSVAGDHGVVLDDDDDDDDDD